HKLVPLGLRVGASTIRDKLGLPDPDKDEELLGAPPAPTPTPAPVPAPEARARNRAGSVDPVQDDAIDALVDGALTDWEPLMDPLVDPVRALAERAQSEEEFLAGLGELMR